MLGHMAKFAKKILPGLVLMFAAGAGCRAQDFPTESQVSRAQVFVLGSAVWTGYEGGKNLSLTGGADIIFRPLSRVQPGLEARAIIPVDSRNIDGEKCILGGARVEYAHGRIHPYADFLLGYGRLTFVHPITYATGPYTGNNADVYGGGGGLDYTMMRNITLRVDAQKQYWKILKDPGGFYPPTSISIGVVYLFNVGSERR
jgi:hypothetical protein